MSETKVAEIKFGSLYVYTGEDGDAISVAMHGGKPGAWQGISIARMAFPDEHKTREQINAFALQFAAAPDMLAALKAQHNAIDILLAMLIERDKTFMPTKSQVWPMLLQGNAAIAKATGATS